MDLKELTEAMHRFVGAQGWYEPGSPRQQTPRNLAISLALEASEVLEHFQWQEAAADQEELGHELADVMLYLMQLASLSGIDLEEAVLQKLEKNYQRKWEDPAAEIQPDEPPAAGESPTAGTLEVRTRPASNLGAGYPWPFSRSELTGGLRRTSGQGNLVISSLHDEVLPNQHPSRGRVRGLKVDTESASGPQTYHLVVKEPQGASRAGTASAGWREASLYSLLSDQIPLKLPRLVASGAEGAWLAFERLAEGRPPEQWQPEDYALAIDQLVILHDRFWGQAEYLSTYPWLARPLTADLDIYQQVAAAGIKRLKENPESLFHQHLPVMEMLELLVSRTEEIAAVLRRSPATLLNGDYWPGNLVIHPDRSLYVIDWQRAGVGPGLLDLFTFIQSSLWWLEKLPVDPAQIVRRYREGMDVASGQRWEDAEWETLWDYAYMWTFLTDWLDLLGSIPNSVLQTRWDHLESMWLEPLRMAAHRQLLK